MRKSKIIWSLSIFALLVASGVYYFKNNGEKKAQVQTAVVTRGNLDLMAAASGRVEADIQVDVKSRASGEVVDLKVQAGDIVKEGDLLVRLDPADEERRLSDAEAQVATTRARLAQSRSSLASTRADLLEEEAKLARRDAAYRGGLVSGEELQAARTAVAVAREAVVQREADVTSSEAEMARSQLTVEEARKRLSETIIRAPVSGTVLSVAVERGSIVSSGITNVGGGTTLLTVADLSGLHVIVKLDEAEIGSVVAGQDVKIRVDAFPDRTFSGEVERVTPLGVSEANIVTFDVKVRITDERAHLLLPGMSTDVEIVTAHHENVLLLPIAALRRASVSGDTGTRTMNGRDRNGAGEAEKTNAAESELNARESGVIRRRERGGRGMDTSVILSSSSGVIQEAQPPRGRASRRAWIKIPSGEERAVRIGATDGVHAVLLDGLFEGDSVVLNDSTDRDGGAGSRSSNPFMMRGGGGGRR